MPGILRGLALGKHLLLLGFNLQYRTVIAKPETLSTCQNLDNYFVQKYFPLSREYLVISWD